MVTGQIGTVPVCFFAILYSDSIGTSLSPAVYNEIDDVRQVRNEIAHITEATLTDANFQASVDRVLNAFTSLGLPLAEVQEIKNQLTFPTKELENIKKQASDLQAELDQTKSDLNQTKSTLQSTKADLVSAKEENKALTQEISKKLKPFCFLTSTPSHDTISRPTTLIESPTRCRNFTTVPTEQSVQCICLEIQGVGRANLPGKLESSSFLKDSTLKIEHRKY